MRSPVLFGTDCSIKRQNTLFEDMSIYQGLYDAPFIFLLGKVLSVSACNEKHSSLHTLFLEYETQIEEKKYWTMFFNRIVVHMQNF